MIQFIKIVFTLLLFIISTGVSAQEKTTTNRSMITANVGLGYQNTAGDLADRFGANTSMIASISKIFTKGNSLTLEYQLNFGSKIKEDVFAPYRNENGVVIGINGLGAFSFLRMRANYLGISYGQPLHKSDKGFKLQLSGGLLSHYIRILDDSRNLVLADNPYRKGFDRLTNGVAAKQELIYEYHGVTNNYHFNIGLSIMEGFTNPVRSINFDTGLPSARGRLDILYGLQAIWMLPLHKPTDAVKYF